MLQVREQFNSVGLHFYSCRLTGVTVLAGLASCQVDLFVCLLRAFSDQLLQYFLVFLGGFRESQDVSGGSTLFMSRHAEQLHKVVHFFIKILQFISLTLHQLERVLGLLLEDLHAKIECQPSAYVTCGIPLAFASLLPTRA